MKVKVVHKFRDKHTGKHYVRGDVLDITEERYNEIVQVDKLVYPIARNDALSVGDEDTKDLSNESTEAPTIDSEPSGDGFDIMSVRELKEYADATYKLTFKGGMKKAEIIKELRRLERNGK